MFAGSYTGDNGSLEDNAWSWPLSSTVVVSTVKFGGHLVILRSSFGGIAHVRTSLVVVIQSVGLRSRLVVIIQQQTQEPPQDELSLVVLSMSSLVVMSMSSLVHVNVKFGGQSVGLRSSLGGSHVVCIR